MKNPRKSLGPAGGKYRVFVALGKNMMIYLKKKVKIRKEKKNGYMKVMVIVLGEKISYWKKGKGQKYHILGKYTPLI